MKYSGKTSWIQIMVLLLLGIASITQAQTIELRKYTNGLDRLDINPPVEIQVGDQVVWQYVVTNTGETALSGIAVTDDQGVMVTCPSDTLDAGESMICQGIGTAVEGSYQNTGTVTASDPDDNPVTDSDDSSYNGVNAGNSSDSDGDGISDDVDQCENSDTNATVIIAGCDSGVGNILFDDGCTMTDHIDQCAIGAKNHGKFVSCVAKLTNYWKKNKFIRGKEKGSIQHCAAKSHIP
jgi:hypothetical protein